MPNDSDDNKPRRERRRGPLFLLAMGLVTAVGLLLLTEGAIWVTALVMNEDYRLNLSPLVPTEQVLCGQGEELYLCPDQGKRYERVRPERFTKTPKVPRVIIIGESFVHGLGLTMDKAMPARLEAALGSAAEVLNFGRCGSYAGALRPALTAALTLKPHVVVLAIGNNEHTMTTFFVGWAGRHPSAFRRITSLLSPFQIPGLLNRGLGSPVRLREEATLPARTDLTELETRLYAARRRPPDLSLFEQNLAWPGVSLALEEEHKLKQQIFAAHLRDMVRAIRNARAKPVLATPPQRLTDPPTLSGCHSTADGACLSIRKILKFMHPGTDDRLRGHLNDAMALDPKVAMVHHYLAKIALEEHHDQEAIKGYTRAADLDLVPEGTPTLRQIIRDVAASENVPLADLDQLAVKYLRDPHDVFMDRVHLNARGCDEAARMLDKQVRPLLKQAWVQEPGARSMKPVP